MAELPSDDPHLQSHEGSEDMEVDGPSSRERGEGWNVEDIEKGRRRKRDERDDDDNHLRLIVREEMTNYLRSNLPEFIRKEIAGMKKTRPVSKKNEPAAVYFIENLAEQCKNRHRSISRKDFMRQVRQDNDNAILPPSHVFERWCEKAENDKLSKIREFLEKEGVLSKSVG
jgi:hypothetical protein